MRFSRVGQAQQWANETGWGIAEGAVLTDQPSHRYARRGRPKFAAARGPRLFQLNPLRPRVRVTLIGTDAAVLERWYPAERDIHA